MENETCFHFLLAEDPGGSHSQAVVATAKELQEFISEHTASSKEGFVCLLCGKRFATFDSIRVHARDKHVNADIVYLCPVCQKYFKTRSSMSGHVYIIHPEMKGIDLDRFARKKW